MENQKIKSKKVISKIDQVISGLKEYAVSNKKSLLELLLEIKTDFENLLLKSDTENSKDIRAEKIDAEIKLEESENMFLTTLYSIGDAVISTDNEGKILLMNPVAEQLTGWKEKEVHKKSLFKIFNIINQDTRKKVQNPVERVISEGIIVGLSNHTLLISKDGKEIPISDSGAPIKDRNGNIHGVILVFRDNTKEVRANRLIHKSEIRLRRAEIASLSGNWELNLKTGKIIGSVGAKKLYELHNDFFDYEEIKKIPLPEYRPLLDNALKNLIEHNDPYDLEFKIKTAQTGEIKHIHSTAFYDKEKSTLFGVIQDISKRKEVEQALRESEQRYRTLFDSGTAAIFVHPYLENGFGKFIEVNKVTCERLEYTRDELLNMTVNEIAECEAAKYRGSINERKEFLIQGKTIFETVHVTKSGKRIPVEIFSKLIEYENSKAIFSVSRDITERKQAEEKLKNRMIELERFNKIMVGRELRMLDLKKEVNELFEKLGQKKKYKTK